MAAVVSLEKTKNKDYEENNIEDKECIENNTVDDGKKKKKKKKKKKTGLV